MNLTATNGSSDREKLTHDDEDDDDEEGGVDVEDITSLR